MLKMHRLAHLLLYDKNFVLLWLVMVIKRVVFALVLLPSRQVGAGLRLALRDAVDGKGIRLISPVFRFRLANACLHASSPARWLSYRFASFSASIPNSFWGLNCRLNWWRGRAWSCTTVLVW